MTLKVFEWSTTMRTRRQTTELETIEPIVLMSGVEPFFRQFADLRRRPNRPWPTNPRPWAGLLRVVSRSYRAAAYARDWALAAVISIRK